MQMHVLNKQRETSVQTHILHSALLCTPTVLRPGVLPLWPTLLACCWTELEGVFRHGSSHLGPNGHLPSLCRPIPYTQCARHHHGVQVGSSFVHVRSHVCACRSHNHYSCVCTTSESSCAQMKIQISAQYIHKSHSLQSNMCMRLLHHLHERNCKLHQSQSVKVMVAL